MALIQQSSNYTRTFLMVLTSDHLTGSGSGGVTVNLSKAGGVFSLATGSAIAISGGLYSISLNSTDTSTMGDLSFYCTGTGVDPTNFTDQIIGINLLAPSLTCGTTVQPVQIAGGTYTFNQFGSVNNVIQATTTIITGGTISGVSNPVFIAAGTYAVNFTGSINNVIQSISATLTGGTISGVSGSVGSVIAPVLLAAGTYAVNLGGSVNNIIIPPALSLAGGTYAVNLTGSINNIINPVNITGGTISAVTGAVGSVTGNVGGSVGSVTGSVNSVTTPISLAGGTYAANFGGSINNIINPVSITGGTISAVTGAVGSVTGSVGSVVGSVGSVTSPVNITGGTISAVTGSVGSVVSGVTVTTNNDKTGYSLASGTQSGVIIPSVVSVTNPVTVASQQIFVKKNAALNGFMFLMLSSTDHVTPKTGLTITSSVSINGAGFNSTANSATEIANGIYTINLAAADTNGNTLMFLFTGAGADNRYVEIITQT